MAFLLAAACTQSTSEGSPRPGSTVLNQLVIGATLPLTGAEARIGGSYKEGYELAFEEANTKGGLLIGGKRVPVVLRLLDDESAPETSISLAERLIAVDKVSLLLGTYSSSLVEAQSAVAEKYLAMVLSKSNASLSAIQHGIYSYDGVHPFTSLEPGHQTVSRMGNRQPAA